MIDQDDEIADAADTLRAHGNAVEMTGPDLARWTVNGVEIEDDDLMALAASLGLREGPEGAAVNDNRTRAADLRRRLLPFLIHDPASMSACCLG